jgi:nitrate reductase gamma subunit
MMLEVLFFRSLFRNTKMELHEGPKLTYAANKFLWLAAIVFHYSFLVVFVRHLRFFVEPVPQPLLMLQEIDGFLQIGVPVVYITSFTLLLGVGYLFLRRVFIPQVRYISLAADYFPLFLIIGIACTGILLRHFVKTDIVGVKEIALGLLAFKPVVPEGVHWLFYAHFLMVTVLFAYFPFSKLMHMAGVFLSPTRNLANNNRMKRHINPWNYPVKVHTYEEYEDDFREKMVKAGLPVEKGLPAEKE